MSLTALHLLETLDAADQASIFSFASRGLPIEIFIDQGMIVHVAGVAEKELPRRLLDQPENIRILPLPETVTPSTRLPLRKFILECALANDLRPTRTLATMTSPSSKPSSGTLMAEPIELRFQNGVSAKLVLGRRSDCDISLRSSGGSRKHCEITFDGQGFRIRDLGSKNGTYLNGDLIMETSARPNDELSIGSEIFRLVVG